MISYLYALIIYPIEMLIETVFSVSMEMVSSAGYAIIFVSIAVQLLVLPIYKRADELQEEERLRQEKMAPMVKHIKKTFSGDERVMILAEYYRQEQYHTYYQLKGILPLLLQVPFFIAAYNYLSSCPVLNGAAFYFLRDMGKPDALLNAGGLSLNVMPFIMTLINIISGTIYTKGMGMKDRLQLYLTAMVFLVLLYNSPSGLVFYWTLNNLFSLFKNIFMKLVKHPREIASVASVLFVTMYCYKCYIIGNWDSPNGRIVMIFMLIIGWIPGVSLILDKVGIKEEKMELQSRIFQISSLIGAVNLGILIPVTTIASSPTEFVIRGHYVSPLTQVLYCMFTAVGLLVVWGNIIYCFYSERAKKVLAFAMFITSACGLINFQFFRKGLANMSMNLHYYDGFSWDMKEKMVNIAVLSIIFIVSLILYRYNKKAVMFTGSILLGVSMILSALNVFNIQKAIMEDVHIRDNDYYINSRVRYDMDRTGKNVVVFFEDRAFGPFMPYIINEKPELADIYSDFVYYKNTLSHGTNTNTGSPALYGGYEYTVYNVRDKDEEYRDNCVKVMPRIFSDNGYKTTVLDMPYYINLKNQSMEEFWKSVNPSIKAYYADGVVKTEEEAIRDYEYFSNIAKSTFIRHSVFISSPLILRDWLYDDGRYLTQEPAEDRITYAGHVEELDKFSDLADLSSSGNNTFTIVENDTPHSMDVNLQMPDYTLEDIVDNTELMDDWRKKLYETPSDREIRMYTNQQIQAYEVNMAAMLSIARWIEFLKKNDIYDNTRIIIVGDHGYSFSSFEEMIMDVGDGAVTDLDMFTPLLMVKDFSAGAESKPLETSDEFMTIADVPTIALKDLIKDPVNPYTGKLINDDQKHERRQYVYDDRIWLSVSDNVNHRDNWKVEDNIK